MRAAAVLRADSQAPASGALPDAALASRDRVYRAEEALRRLCRESPELARFRDQSGPDGGVGRFGFLQLCFERDEARSRSVLREADRRAPLLVQKALYWDEALPDMPCVMIITTTGCVVQGDRLSLHIRVGSGARAHVTTQSAAKVHMMDRGYAVQAQDIEVGDGGFLEYVPDPVILHRRARFLSDTRITVAETGSLILADMPVPGRRFHREDELFGFDLYAWNLVVRRPVPAGEPLPAPLFAERGSLCPADADPRRTGVLNGFEIAGSVLVLGPPEPVAALREQADAGMEAARLAWGCSLLPCGCGLLFRVLGMRVEQVREKMQDLLDLSRKALTGADPAPRFLWR